MHDVTFANIISKIEIKFTWHWNCEWSKPKYWNYKLLQINTCWYLVFTVATTLAGNGVDFINEYGRWGVEARLGVNAIIAMKDHERAWMPTNTLIVRKIYVLQYPGYITEQTRLHPWTHYTLSQDDWLQYTKRLTSNAIQRIFELICNDTFRNNDTNHSKQTGYIPYRTAAAPASQHLHGTLRSALMTTHWRTLCHTP